MVSKALISFNEMLETYVNGGYEASLLPPLVKGTRAQLTSLPLPLVPASLDTVDNS